MLSTLVSLNSQSSSATHRAASIYYRRWFCWSQVAGLYGELGTAMCVRDTVYKTVEICTVWIATEHWNVECNKNILKSHEASSNIFREQLCTIISRFVLFFQRKPKISSRNVLKMEPLLERKIRIAYRFVCRASKFHTHFLLININGRKPYARILDI